MTKRIFQAILGVALATLTLGIGFVLAIFFPYFEQKLADEMQRQLVYLAPGVEAGGIAYLEQMASAGNRLTLIAADGTVLYDSLKDAATMDNFADRPEVQDALNKGQGRNTHHYKTFSRNSLSCAIKLADGSVLRITSLQYSGLALMLSLIQPILVLLVLTAVLSGVFAYRFSKYLTLPLNQINLERPNLHPPVYEELTPLLRRISNQNQQIKGQMTELRQQQQQFTAITEHMQEGFLVLDSKGKILSHNPAASRFLQIGQLSGQLIKELELCDELLQAVHSAATGRHTEIILPLYGRTCQLFANPVFQADMIAGTVLVLMDVTEQQQRESLRREFSANVSHELKTPLTSISGIAEIMCTGLMSDDDIPHFAGKIYDESQRLIHLVQDILRISQLDEDSVLDHAVSVDLYARAKLVLEQLSAEASKAKVTLLLQGKPAVIDGIPSILDEVLYNLCENAIKYNTLNGTVTVTVKGQPHHAIVTVADTGIGIPPEHQDRIFERFYRVDKSHSKEIGGTGLGLSIVKHGVVYHRAQLRLDSTLGVGTSIQILFPYLNKT